MRIVLLRFLNQLRKAVTMPGRANVELVKSGVIFFRRFHHRQCAFSIIRAERFRKLDVECDGSGTYFISLRCLSVTFTTSGLYLFEPGRVELRVFCLGYGCSLSEKSDCGGDEAI
jgi:hypothetical protein